MPISCYTMEKLSAFLSAIGRRVLSKWVPFLLQLAETPPLQVMAQNCHQLDHDPSWTPGDKYYQIFFLLLSTFIIYARVFHKTWSLLYQLQNPAGELQESDYFSPPQLSSVEVTDKTPLCPAFTGVLGKFTLRSPYLHSKPFTFWGISIACSRFFKWVSSGWEY